MFLSLRYMGWPQSQMPCVQLYVFEDISNCFAYGSVFSAGALAFSTPPWSPSEINLTNWFSK